MVAGLSAATSATRVSGVMFIGFSFRETERLCPHVPGDHAAETANPLFDDFRPRVGKVESHGIPAATVGMEGHPGDEGDLLLQGPLQELPGIESFGQGHPEEET